jgi:T5SS/PEP-CTERM-associated repeat protein
MRVFIQSTRSMRFFCRVFGLVIVFVCLLWGSAAHAVIFSDGDIIPVPPGAGGNVPGPFEIGNSTVGIMDINGGTALTNTNSAVIGDTVTGLGIVTMDGFESSWTMTTAGADLTLGNNGTGSLRIENRASMRVNDVLFVAAQPNSMGEIFISGLGSIMSMGSSANIGQRGQAVITIADGGRLLSVTNIIGDESTGDGRVIVKDQFSLWRMSNAITIGDAGRGSLQVLNGARVENASGTSNVSVQIAAQASSSGSAEVSGAGSLWQSTLGMVVGDFGHGTLRVADGGRVSIGTGANLFVIGRNIGGVGSVEITGANSLLTAAVTEVGDSGDGTLRILNGARADTGGGIIGNNSSARGEVLVDGVGSTWEVSGEISVSEPGEGHLTISNGGLVRSSSISRVAGNGRLTLNAGRMEVGGTIGLFNTGIIEGNGAIEVIKIDNNAGGRLRPRGAEALSITGTLNNNFQGLVDADGGVLEVAGPTNNNADIDARNDAILRFRVPSLGLGLDNNAGSRLAITSGNVDVFGTIDNNAGAEITVGATGVAVFHDAVTNSGTLFVQPGGKVLMLENLALAGGATLSLPLGAAGLGQVDVAGAAQLAGNVDVTVADGFAPRVGDQFGFLTSEGRRGTFAGVTDSGAGIDFQAIYTATDAALLVVGEGDKTWGVDANGNSSLGSNWLGGVAPGAVGDKVAFTTIITGDTKIDVDVPFVAASLYFDDNNAYLIQGSNPITLDVASGNARIDVKNFHGIGAHTVAVPLMLNDSTTIDVAAGSTLSLTGQMTAAPRVVVTKTGAGTVVVKNVRADGLAVNGGTVQVLPGGGPSVVKSLSVASTARLDLTDNALVVDYAGPASPLGQVRAQIVSGFAGGTWSGDGITSSTAASNPTRAIGYGEASSILSPAGGTFAGQSVDGTAVLVRVTIKGDANLDGVVNFPDLVALAQNYNTLTGDAPWNRGDFTYDGNVDFTDLVALAQNYNTALPATAIPGAGEDFYSALAMVPEPTLTTLMALLCGLMTRRRRERP